MAQLSDKDASGASCLGHILLGNGPGVEPGYPGQIFLCCPGNTLVFLQISWTRWLGEREACSPYDSNRSNWMD